MKEAKELQAPSVERQTVTVLLALLSIDSNHLAWF